MRYLGKEVQGQAKGGKADSDAALVYVRSATIVDIVMRLGLFDSV
jgi:hypothetical protein